MNKIKMLIILYVSSIIGLFLYSYTQVDLSLTLSQISFQQTVEKSFQYIGYFQRPLSAVLYMCLLVLLFGTYIGFLIAASKKKLSRKIVWMLILFTGVVLTFSYNAFSYDLFNYIFDAKIITHYMQNPYLHKALDFPTDPMLSFMHWVERTYPYGPIWILFTIPVSFVGLQFFLPTFFLFKAVASVSYFGTAWVIEKILRKTRPELSIMGLVIFAFSPLVLIEGLVSGHNDMFMVLLISLSLLQFVNKKVLWSFVLLFLSIGVKFATAVLLPLWIIGTFVKKKGDIQNLAVVSFVLLVIPVIIASLRTNFQPWYVLFLFPFAALISRKEFLASFTIFSFGSLLQYIPFLYTGNWDKPIPYILFIMLWVSLAASIVSGVIFWLFGVAKRS